MGSAVNKILSIRVFLRILWVQACRDTSPLSGTVAEHLAAGSSAAGVATLGQNAKIDRSFIMDIEHDDGDKAIVASIVSMGHSLNLEVLAEGIETEGQLRLLSAMGCYLGAGLSVRPPGAGPPSSVSGSWISLPRRLFRVG